MANIAKICELAKAPKWPIGNLREFNSQKYFYGCLLLILILIRNQFRRVSYGSNFILDVNLNRIFGVDCENNYEFYIVM